MLIDSAARLRGFERDLGLKGQEFATILSILYVGYIIMQIPSSVLSVFPYKKLMMINFFAETCSSTGWVNLLYTSRRA